jgi:hypothetical protein
LKIYIYKPTTIEKIGKVYSLEYTDILKVFFKPHHTYHCCTTIEKIGKVYSLEYNDIPKVFFMPYHRDNCYNNVI